MSPSSFLLHSKWQVTIRMVSQIPLVRCHPFYFSLSLYIQVDGWMDGTDFILSLPPATWLSRPLGLWLASYCVLLTNKKPVEMQFQRFFLSFFFSLAYVQATGCNLNCTQQRKSRHRFSKKKIFFYLKKKKPKSMTRKLAVGNIQHFPILSLLFTLRVSFRLTAPSRWVKRKKKDFLYKRQKKKKDVSHGRSDRRFSGKRRRIRK